MTALENKNLCNILTQLGEEFIYRKVSFLCDPEKQVKFAFLIVNP